MLAEIESLARAQAGVGAAGPARANPPGPRDKRPRPAATPSAYTGPVPIVTHVHGMEEVEDWSDGYPEAWYLPAASNLPAGYASVGTWYDFFRSKCGEVGWSPAQATYRYPNTQRPATLWFHDHALGITRLNVYAGLAGFYLIRSDGSGRSSDSGGRQWSRCPAERAIRDPACDPGPGPSMRTGRFSTRSRAFSSIASAGPIFRPATCRRSGFPSFSATA